MFHSRDIAHDQVSCAVQRDSSNSKILDTNPTLRILDVLAAKKTFELRFFRNPKNFGCVGCGKKT